MRRDLAVEVAQHGERVGAFDRRSGGRPRRRRGRSCRPTGRPASRSPITAATWRSRWIDRAPGAHQRVGDGALDPRADVAPALLRRRRGAPGRCRRSTSTQRAGDRVGAGEVGAVVLARAGRAARSSTVLIVSIVCGASPERMFARLAPSACSSPLPSEWRRSSSAASRGWLVTIALPRSFSHQRKAGMSSLSPCRRPAWQAPVCEDQSVSQRQPVAAGARSSARASARCRRGSPAAGRRGRGRRSPGE